jgi:hypothetical protein
MTRRGEIGRTQLARWWPHHVALPAEAVRGIANSETVCGFASTLSVAPRTYTLRRDGRNVSHTPGTTYAPARFGAEAEAKAACIKSSHLADAMTRLFAAGRIRVEQYGRPSRPYHRIVET